MRKVVSCLLILTFLTTYVSPAALAQDFAEPDRNTRKAEASPAPAAEDLDGSWQECNALGKADAQDRATGGSFAGGLAGGIFLGLIGTGIAVLAQSKSDPPAALLLRLDEQEADCRYTYIESYRNESVSKKRKAALAGGLVGTAIIVTVYLATQGS